MSEAQGQVASGFIAPILDPALYTNRPRYDGSVVPTADGGTGLVFTVVEGKARLVAAQATHRADQIVGFTSDRRVTYGSHGWTTPERESFRGVISGSVSGALVYENNVLNPEVPIGSVVYYRPSLGRLSVEAGTDGIPCGYVTSNVWRLTTGQPAETNGVREGYNYESTVISSSENVVLDQWGGTDAHKALLRAARFVGDEMIVYYDNSSLDADAPASITVYAQNPGEGENTEITTIPQGEARTLRCTALGTATTPNTWAVVTDRPFKAAYVEVNTHFLRDSAPHALTATEVASTQGIKSSWTLAAGAPPGTTQKTDSPGAGTLTVAGRLPNETLLVKFSEVKDGAVTDRETMTLPVPETSFVDYHALDGNVVLRVSAGAGFQVIHIASGVGYSWATTVYILGAS